MPALGKPRSGTLWWITLEPLPSSLSWSIGHVSRLLRMRVVWLSTDGQLPPDSTAIPFSPVRHKVDRTLRNLRQKLIDTVSGSIYCSDGTCDPRYRWFCLCDNMKINYHGSVREKVSRFASPINFLTQVMLVNTFIKVSRIQKTITIRRRQVRSTATGKWLAFHTVGFLKATLWRKSHPCTP